MCVECREYTRPGLPDDIIYKCEINNDDDYRYGHRCKPGIPNKCGDGTQKCMDSWPRDKGKKSPERACRDLPDVLDVQIDSNWAFKAKVEKSSKGLCYFGCDGGTCHKSWAVGGKWNDSTATWRCKPKGQE